MLCVNIVGSRVLTALLVTVGMAVANTERVEARTVWLRCISRGRATGARRLGHGGVTVHDHGVQCTSALAISAADVVMVAASARPAGSQPHSAFAAVVSVDARVAVGVGEFDAALLAWMLLVIAQLESWVGEAC